jgi:hypothetical protein
LALYKGIIDTALASAERGPAIAAFIESTLGPENMGYDVRVIPYHAKGEPLPGIPPDKPELRKALDVEVTGKNRRKDLVVLVTDYLPAAATLPELRPSGLPTFLGIAHACTGLGGVRTLRFAAVPDLQGLAAWAHDTRERGDRITHVALLGGLAGFTDAALHEAMGTTHEGVILLRPAFGGLEAATALKQQCLELATKL